MDLRKLKTLIDLVSESNISELEITEAEGFGQGGECDVAAPVRLKEFGHFRMPGDERRILAAALPIFLSGRGGEEEEPVAIVVNGHTDMVDAHALRDIGPQLIVREFVFVVRARAQFHG